VRGPSEVLTEPGSLSMSEKGVMRMVRTRIGAVAAVVIAVALLAGAIADTAAADERIESAGFALSNPDGTFNRQAGAHADFRTKIVFPEEQNPNDALPHAKYQLRDLEAELPPGLVGNPTAAPTCSQLQIVGGSGGTSPMCPIGSQVGIAYIYGNNFAPPEPVPVYNMEQPSSLPALLEMNFLGVLIRIEPNVRAGDYGLTAITQRTSQAIPIFGVDLRLWGVPADPSHDSQRFNPVAPGVFLPENIGYEPPTPSPSPRAPFMTNPTSCAGPAIPFSISADFWESPGAFATVTTDSDLEGTPFQMQGCNRLAFNPAVSVKSVSASTDAPSGLSFDLNVPQNESPDGLATPDVRRVSVTLPQGFSISPSSANGLGACAPDQIKLGSNDEPTCPETSKLGTVTIDTPLLKEPLQGDVDLATQNDNPFDSLVALYIVAKGPGFYLKLPGRVDLDSRTGQVTTTFDNNPQLPFSDLQLTLREGPQAPLSTPSQCGAYTARTELAPWSGTAPVVLNTPITINQGCGAGRFAPKLNAGTSDPTGGAYSPFTLQVTRGEGEGNLASLKATLPPGLLAKLAGVPLCGETQAATGACPAASQVGTTTVGVGTGPLPVYVPEAGKAPTGVYLAGSYKGAPYSLVVKVPAQAGPFDLGTVVVRNALQVDPFTTQVTAESDPLPQILDGIPVSYRDLRVEVNRPDFTINPTNCSQFAVTSLLTSASGQTSTPRSPFAAASCERLEFKPALQVQLKGSTRRTAHPALKAVLTYPSKGAYANIARAQVNLPHSEFLDQNNLDKTCTKPVLLAGNCPASSVYGKAKAWSPLLDKPLEGPVYLVGGFGYKLPALVADLNGQIRVILKSKIDTGPNKGLRATFEAVPDAPVSRFVLEMKGGKKYGLLVNSEDVCKQPQRVKASFTAQNAKTDNFEQKIATDCGGGKGSKKKH
jgi:hypothetical protein